MPANVNCGIDVEDRLLCIVANSEEVLNLVYLFFLDITVQEKCCVVLLVVDMRLGTFEHLRRSLVPNQPLQVLDEKI